MASFDNAALAERGRGLGWVNELGFTAVVGCNVGCLADSIAHPGSVVNAHESRPCSSRFHRSSALRTLHLPACPVPEAHSARCVRVCLYVPVHVS